MKLNRREPYSEYSWKLLFAICYRALGSCLCLKQKTLQSVSLKFFTWLFLLDRLAKSFCLSAQKQWLLAMSVFLV